MGRVKIKVEMRSWSDNGRKLERWVVLEAGKR